MMGQDPNSQRSSSNEPRQQQDDEREESLQGTPSQFLQYSETTRSHYGPTFPQPSSSEPAYLQEQQQLHPDTPTRRLQVVPETQSQRMQAHSSLLHPYREPQARQSAGSQAHRDVQMQGMQPFERQQQQQQQMGTSPIAQYSSSLEYQQYQSDRSFPSDIPESGQYQARFYTSPERTGSSSSRSTSDLPYQSLRSGHSAYEYSGASTSTLSSSYPEHYQSYEPGDFWPQQAQPPLPPAQQQQQQHQPKPQTQAQQKQLHHQQQQPQQPQQPSVLPSLQPLSTATTSQWQPRAASAPSISTSSSVPMFGERLLQRASVQLSNIPHIPNIVVDAVPARDNFGHSRTPPFVQSDWASQWGLHVPSSSKKTRTNSDSAIYEAEKEQHHKATGYIPSSWELLSFYPSPTGTEHPKEHIMAAAEASSKPGQLSPRTYQAQQRSHHAASTVASPDYLVSQEMSSPAPEAMDVDIEGEHQVLNLKVEPQKHSITSPTKPPDTSKPTVPFIWKFQAQKSSESPKTAWLRRHSDSNVPSGSSAVEPEDLTIPKQSAGRSRSTGETILEEKATEKSSETGRETEAASSDASREMQPSQEHGGDLLSKRLKLKKYLQKRYQLSLESTSRHHSTESDDVFSPSPGIFGTSQGFVFSPTLIESASSPRPQRPSPLASTSQQSPIKISQSLAKPLEIKTEPISPISSESEGESDAGVFLSPAFISPQSVSPSSQGNVFQFHSPASYSRSSESEKSDSSHRPEMDSRIGRAEVQRGSVSPSEHLSQETYMYSESTAVEQSMATTDPPNVEILHQGSLSPLASMLSHPSFTHPNLPSFSAPQTPPFVSYQTSKSSKPSAAAAAASSEQSSSTAATGSSTWPQTGRVRSMSETDKPLEPSKIIYCPFSEKVQEQRYQREMTFLCPVCGQMFPSYNYLANHMVNHLPSEVVSKGPGEGNKVHLCKVCNRSFSRSDMLTRHMRLHTGLRPYECRMCGQVFSRSDHLHTHLRTHTGEKPYRCPQCPYAAPRRDMITRHMRIHTKHFSRRGRRTSSTGSADTLQSSSFSSLESGDSDIKKRNQSLSSMGSEGSTEASPFRRSSGASIDTAELDLSRPRHWSHTSAESIDSSADIHGIQTSAGTPTKKFSQKWSLSSIESEDTAAARAASDTAASQLSAEAQRGHRSASATSMDSGGTEESQGTTISMDIGGRDTPGGAEQAEMQSSFQRCCVGSDKESSESEHASPAHAATLGKLTGEKQT